MDTTTARGTSPFPTLRAWLADYANTVGCSTEALAARAGVSRSSLYEALASPATRPGVLEKLAEHTGAEASWLASLPGGGAKLREAHSTPLRDLVREVAAQRGISLDTLMSTNPNLTRSAGYRLLRPEISAQYQALRALAAHLDRPVEQIFDAAGIAAHTPAPAGSVSPAQRRPRVSGACRSAERSSTRIAQAVTAVCQQRSCSQRQLAREEGLPLNFFTRLLAGRAPNPSPARRQELAAILAVSLETLDAMLTEIPTPYAEQGRELMLARTARGLRQSDVAAACGGLHGHYVTSWERGVTPIPARYRPSIAELFARTPVIAH